MVADFRTDTDESGGSDPIGSNLGRVKVRFFWDRAEDRGGREGDLDSSCWIRVGQFWAGKRWGAHFWPLAAVDLLLRSEMLDYQHAISPQHFLVACQIALSQWAWASMSTLARSPMLTQK